MPHSRDFWDEQRVFELSWRTNGIQVDPGLNRLPLLSGRSHLLVVPMRVFYCPSSYPCEAATQNLIHSIQLVWLCFGGDDDK